jgi:zinc D-Ala-D-Ala carboxypeptidase
MVDWKYFSPAELKCRCGACSSTGQEMNAAFMKKLVFIREALDFPFVISSAYRCPSHNSKVSATGINGAHTTGRAVDIAVRNEEAYSLISKAPVYGFTGIGVNQKGGSRFIHLDDLAYPAFPRPTVWSY